VSGRSYHWLHRDNITWGPTGGLLAAAAKSCATVAEFFTARAEGELRDVCWFREATRDDIVDVALALSSAADTTFNCVGNAIEAWRRAEEASDDDAAICCEYVYRAFDAYLVAHYFAVYAREWVMVVDPSCRFLRHLTHYYYYTEAEQAKVSNVFLACAGPALGSL